jgi:anti-sigma factor (TIGR02949 family)
MNRYSTHRRQVNTMSDIKEIGCEEALRHLFEYLDRELDATRHAEMEHHLHACRACFSRAEFEKRLKARLGALGRSRPTSSSGNIKGDATSVLRTARRTWSPSSATSARQS